MPRARVLSGKSAKTSSPVRKSRNALLAALPPEEARRLRPHLNHVVMKPRQALHTSGELLRTIYFPTDGVCSVVTTMEDGRTVEVATIGNEGMTGISAIFGGAHAVSTVVVQLPGTAAEALPIEIFSAEITRRGALYQLASRYANARLALVMQSAACNGLHAAHERCARWLLHTHDRVGKDTFALTQEFLAAMLGVRRATITAIAGEFQRAHLVQFGRRRVTILDRQGLEAGACECYHVIRAQFEKLF
jgi:CRP-like cAMP-binding protein